VVLGQQRSGTTALRSTLTLGTKAHDFSEIFHHDRGNTLFNFFNFKENEVVKSPDLVYPSAENQRILWTRYVEMLRSSVEKPLVMVDVKYNCWHHLDPVYHRPLERPQLLSWMFEDGARVLHVTRRDLFAQACSEQIAEARGAWHEAVDETSSKRLREQASLTLESRGGDADPVVLDPGLIEQTMRRSDETRRLFREWCADYDHYAEVEYETLFGDARLSERTYEVLDRLTGIGLDEQQPVLLKKITKDLRSEIANLDEVRKYLSNGPYATSADDVEA